MSGEPFRHRLRVRYGECDLQGVVFNANYLAYADVAITELFRAAFGSWEAATSGHGFDMVVAAARIDFRAPLRFDDEVELVTRVARLGETSLETRIGLERGGEEAAAVELRHVFVDERGRGKIPIPPAVRAGLSRYA